MTVRIVVIIVIVIWAGIIYKKNDDANNGWFLPVWKFYNYNSKKIKIRHRKIIWNEF